ncbi:MULTISPECIES: hypothetical protein [unclassified Acinetobacter]|uniref:hypothetical protein n=1 Tax=unclassified Acinetobacter TaxID=196816 RepID=UPI00148F1B15|nr:MULTISPECIES: hypothetical protein [unclassified Acinetobacter]
MSFFEALQLPISFEADYYSSDAWDERKKEMDADAQRYNTFLKLGNELIKGLNNLGGRR